MDYLNCLQTGLGNLDSTVYCHILFEKEGGDVKGMGKTDGNFMWFCCDGHTTVCENGIVRVLDVNGGTILEKSADRAMIDELDAGGCPLCDGWL